MSWYRETYLQSEDWKNLRLLILIAQDYTCECCGSRATDVHHLLYRKIWDVMPSDLMACCRKCHDAIHEWLRSPTGIKLRAGVERRAKPKGAGNLMKRYIASFVSPRAMVIFNVIRRKDDPKQWTSMTIYSKDHPISKARDAEKRLKKKLDFS